MDEERGTLYDCGLSTNMAFNHATDSGEDAPDIIAKLFGMNTATARNVLANPHRVVRPGRTTLWVPNDLISEEN